MPGEPCARHGRLRSRFLYKDQAYFAIAWMSFMTSSEWIVGSTES
jgi:hypothetical protein